MNYKPYDPDQEYLLPADLREVIPEGDLVYIVDQIVRRLDLSGFYARNSEEGNPPYHPALTLKVLFFAYSIGLRSSRKIEKAVRTDVRFMFLAGRQRPDFHTIARFRQLYREEITELFVQIVAICNELGLVKFAGLAIDGTKIKGNVSKRSFKDKKKLNGYLKAVRKRIKEVLREASDVDQEEGKRFGSGDSAGCLPKDLRNLKELESRIREAQEAIETEGHRLASPTDPDAVFMKGDSGQVNANYNCQAAVDVDSRVVVSADVSRQAADNHHLEGIVEQAESNLGKRVDKVVADCGYYSPETDAYFRKKGKDLYLPGGIGKQNRFNVGYYSLDDFMVDEERGKVICPAGREMRRQGRKGLKSIYRGVGCGSCELKWKCTTSKYRTVEIKPNWGYRREMREKLKTPEGEEMLRKRARSVELVFAWLKHHYGNRKFLLRGLQKVRCEWNLMLIGHNLRRIAAAIG
jgi:transposase